MKRALFKRERKGGRVCISHIRSELATQTNSDNFYLSQGGGAPLNYGYLVQIWSFPKGGGGLHIGNSVRANIIPGSFWIESHKPTVYRVSLNRVPKSGSQFTTNDEYNIPKPYLRNKKSQICQIQWKIRLRTLRILCDDFFSHYSKNFERPYLKN